MISTYCNYGLYDEDSGRCYEEYDTVNIKMTDGTTYLYVCIKSISEDEIVIEDVYNETTLLVDEILEIDD